MLLQIYAAAVTLSQSNRSEVVCVHDALLHRHVCVQDGTAIANTCVVNEDVHVTVAFQNLRRCLGHTLRVREVKGHCAGCICLTRNKNKARRDLL